MPRAVMLARMTSPRRQLPLGVRILVVLWSFVFIWGVALSLYVHHVFMCFPLLTVFVALLFMAPVFRQSREGFATYLMSSGSGRSPPYTSEADAGKADLAVRYTAIRDDESGFVDINLQDEDADDGV